MSGVIEPGERTPSPIRAALSQPRLRGYSHAAQIQLQTAFHLVTCLIMAHEILALRTQA